MTRRLSSVLLQDIVSQEQGMSERDRGKERGETVCVRESELNRARQHGERNAVGERQAEDDRGKEIFFRERSEVVT